MKILLAEDDNSVAKELTDALISQHHIIELAGDGKAAWELAESIKYDLMLLDMTLPELDGIRFCRQRRLKGDRTPIVLLTAQDDLTQKAAVLDAGADDCIVKPLNLPVLLARIRGLLRPGSSISCGLLEWGALRLNLNRCEVTYGGQLLQLTAKEYALLELFLRNKNRIFSQTTLLAHLWSLTEPPSENSVRGYIQALRQKLKQAGAHEDVIEAVYGLGYRLKTECKIQGTEIKEFLMPHHRSAISNSPITTLTEPPLARVKARFTAVWQKFKDVYSDRITVVEQAIAALKQDTLSEALRQEALRELHTLVGSLGTFGFTKASQLSCEIKQILKAVDSIGPKEVEHLSKSVVELREELKQPPTIVEPTMSPAAPIKHQLRLLVVEDDQALAMALMSEATERGIQTELAEDLSKARSALARSQPDVVLLDLSFPNSIENGFGLLAELSAQHPSLPVLVFTAQESFADRVTVAKLGGRGFLQKPIAPAAVIEAILQVVQNSSVPEANLLIVDDDPQILDLLRTLLSPWGFKIALLDNPEQFWETLEETAPDLLILDVEMPGLSGIDLCQVVRNDPRWSELPILFLSAHTDAQIVQRVFHAGADDYISKPIVGPELVARVLNRLERTQLLRKLAETDGLTGLMNRRKCSQELTRLLHLAERQKQSLCFILLDLDHFKQINDRYGHDTGDKVLKYVGELLKPSFRREDVVARWGGEEFVIGLYGMTREFGIQRLTEVLNSLYSQEFTDTNHQTFHVSFSAGVAEYPQDGVDLPALYQVADTALYQAKTLGRNRVLSCQQF